MAKNIMGISVNCRHELCRENPVGNTEVDGKEFPLTPEKAIKGSAVAGMIFKQIDAGFIIRPTAPDSLADHIKTEEQAKNFMLLLNSL